MSAGRSTLWASPTSPYARKVAVLILEAGITDVDIVTASGSPLNPGTVPTDYNPLGKIPILRTSDGGILFDSRVICRWLDAQSGAGLYPDAPALWRVLTLEAMADGILDAALLMVYESRIRPLEYQFAPWVDGQWEKISRSLDAIEAGWQADLSAPLNMGQIALGVALGYLDLRHSGRNWRRERPALAAWERQFALRPALVGTLPEGGAR